jgi:hypothetical protein
MIATDIPARISGQLAEMPLQRQWPQLGRELLTLGKSRRANWCCNVVMCVCRSANWVLRSLGCRPSFAPADRLVMSVGGEREGASGCRCRPRPRDKGTVMNSGYLMKLFQGHTPEASIESTRVGQRDGNAPTNDATSSSQSQACDNHQPKKRWP